MEQHGPDRAAAEWLLRCAASFRYAGHRPQKACPAYGFVHRSRPKGHKDFVSTKKQLKQLPTPFFIESIDATDSAMHAQGFDYLGKLSVYLIFFFLGTPHFRWPCAPERAQIESLLVDREPSYLQSGCLLSKQFGEIRTRLLRERYRYGIAGVADVEEIEGALSLCFTSCHQSRPRGSSGAACMYVTERL